RRRRGPVRVHDRAHGRRLHRPRNLPARMRATVAIALLLGAAVAAAGAGCGACHTIAAVDGADGKVGPPLAHFADRRYIAGELPNTPENLVRWIMDPQAVEPRTVMPDLDVGEPQARDIAAYLYRH